MIKNWTATKEEVEAIKEVISKILQLWQYDFISANNGDDGSISMSKEEFFKQLEQKLLPLNKDMKKKTIKAWAIVMEDDNDLGRVWTKAHPKDPSPECFVYAIYLTKKPALKDKAFRGGCDVVKCLLTLKDTK